MKLTLIVVICALVCACDAYAQGNVENADSLNILFHDLPDVVVKGERPVAKMEKGKIIYQMPLLLEKLAADNAYEALTKLPGVYEQSSRLQFGGKSLSIIINGRVSTMTYDEIVEMLKTMPAERLEKAELMLSAPANLHVRGAALNIVTRDYKGKRQVSGRLMGTYNQSKYASENLQGNLLFSVDKLTIDANYDFSHNKSFGEVDHEAMHPLASGPVAYADHTENVSDIDRHQYRFGADYQFGKDHLLGLSYRGSSSDGDSRNVTTGSCVSGNMKELRSTLNNVDLNYMMPFGLNVSASYTGYRSPQNQNLDGSIDGDERKYVSSSNQRIDKLMFTADQTHQLKDNWTLSYGAKAQFATNKSYQDTFDGDGNVLPEATTAVSIDERIVNAYAGFGKQVNKSLGFDVSATVENYHAPMWNDWKLYPQFNLMWNVNVKHMLNLSLSSDVVYPSYWYTMSGVSYSSIYSEIWGNPDLKPNSKYDLSLVWRINRKYTVAAFANFEPDFMVQLPYQTSERMAVIMKFVNFDHRNSYGLQLSAPFRLGSWLNGSAFVVGQYLNDKCSDFFDLPFDRSKFSVITGGNAAMTLSKKHRISLNVNPFFQSEAIQGVFGIKNIFRLNAQMRWASNDGHWNVVLRGDNLTNTHFSTRSVYGNQDFAMKVCQNWVNVSLSCAYKFGNYKEKRVKEVDTSRMGH